MRFIDGLCEEKQSGMYIFVKENVPQRQEMESRMII